MDDQHRRLEADYERLREINDFLVKRNQKLTAQLYQQQPTQRDVDCLQTVIAGISAENVTLRENIGDLNKKLSEMVVKNTEIEASLQAALALISELQSQHNFR